MEENGNKLKIEADERFLPKSIKYQRMRQRRRDFSKLLRKSIKYQRIANHAVHKAQEENRALGIPNWYSIGGEIVSDLDIQENNKKTK